MQFENLFEEELAEIGIKFKFNRLLLGLFAASAISAGLIFQAFRLDFYFKLILCSCMLFLPSALLYFFMGYLKDAKQKAIDDSIAEVLFQIAAFPKNTPMEKIIDSIAKKDSPIGTEFKKAQSMVGMGFSTNDALREIAGTNSSTLLKRAISLLLEVYNSGGDLPEAINEIAQDIFDMRLLQKESIAVFSLQKYTILAGVGALIPLILGLLVGIMRSLDSSSQDSILGIATSPGLIISLNFALQLYLFILCALAGIFLSMQEGRIKKAPVYFTMLAICSLLIFNIIGKIGLI